MEWYDGPSLLHHLEEVYIASDRNLIDCRFPVQYVIRPKSNAHHDYRGYAGMIAGGVFKPGDDVVVLPSGFTSTIRSIDTADGPVDEAFPPMSVTMTLDDDVDVSRGDMICRPHNHASVGQELDAMVCWLTDQSELRAGAKLAIKHTTRSARALVRNLLYRLDVNELHRDEDAESLSAQRDRADHVANHRAAVLRRVPPQPHDRQLHPDRRDDEQHRRGGHDPGRDRLATWDTRGRVAAGTEWGP